MRDKPVYIVSAEETYHYGQVIYEEGNSGDWVYVILSGLVEVSKNIHGKKYIIEILQSGDVFGALEYMGHIKRTTTIRSIGVTTLGLIDREFLDREYNQLSAQLRSIVEIMTRKSEKLLNRFSDFVLVPEKRAEKVLSLVFLDGESAYRAHTVDISAKGLFIVTDHLLDTGKEFPIKLQLPDTVSPLQIKCEVLWNRERKRQQPERLPGMGVKFTKISKGDYQILRDFVIIGDGS